METLRISRRARARVGRSREVLLGLLVILATGCPSDSGAPAADSGRGDQRVIKGGPVDLPFDDDEPLEQLSPEELREVCSAGVALVADAAGESICTIVGAFAALDSKGAQSCEAVRDSCLEALSDARGPCSELKPVACANTVREAEVCMNDTGKALSRLLPDVSCVTDRQEFAAACIELATNLQQLDEQRPESCKRLNSECPDFNLGLGEFELPGGLTADQFCKGQGQPVRPDASAPADGRADAGTADAGAS